MPGVSLGMGTPASLRSVGNRSIELTGCSIPRGAMWPGQWIRIGVRRPPSYGDCLDFGAYRGLSGDWIHPLSEA